MMTLGTKLQINLQKYREGLSLRAKRSNPGINYWIASSAFALLAMTTLFLDFASALIPSPSFWVIIGDTTYQKGSNYEDGTFFCRALLRNRLCKFLQEKIGSEINEHCSRYSG